jgi:hypothetical protein
MDEHIGEVLSTILYAYLTTMGKILVYITSFSKTLMKVPRTKEGCTIAKATFHHTLANLPYFIHNERHV